MKIESIIRRIQIAKNAAIEATAQAAYLANISKLRGMYEVLLDIDIEVAAIAEQAISEAQDMRKSQG